MESFFDAYCITALITVRRFGARFRALCCVLMVELIFLCCHVERYQLSRKRRLSSGERSEGVSYERVGKRVKEEGEGEEGAFPQRKGRTLKRKKSVTFLYDD